MTSALQVATTHPTQWRRVLPALLLVLGAVLVAYRDTVEAMVTIWSRSETFAHAFLVPPIVLWLIWRRRDALTSERPQPCAWMLVPMACLALVWLLGDLASVNSVTQLAMTALLVLAVPAVLGLRVAHVILFPLVFLFFAVPIGEFLLPQMMAWTADFTAIALRASGIPVYREGMQLTIPSGNWSVVEACGGVRYLIASFMVGTLFAYLNYRSPRRRWIFVGISIAVPVVANWVRAYFIVLLGHLSDNQLAVGVDHLIYGWLFFGFVIGLMFAIGMLWTEPEAKPDVPAVTAVPAPTSVRHRPREGLWPVAAVAILLTLMPHLILRAIGDVDNETPPQLAAMSNLSDGWKPTRDLMIAWKPEYQNASAELNSNYASRGRDVGVYIGYYRAQNYGRKLVSSNNRLVKSIDSAWAQVAPTGSHTLQTPEQVLTVRTATLGGGATHGAPEQRLLVWQVYWVGGRLTSNDQWAKILGVTDRLLGRGDDSAVIVLYTRQEQPGGAQVVLESFARANLGAIVTQLRRARDDLQTSVAANQRTRPGVTE